MRYIPVLSIAGSDSGGGAGVQADIKTLSALGCYAATAITAITVQDTLGVHGVWPVPPDVVGAQAAAVLRDLRPVAVKVGMLCGAETVRAVADALAATTPRHVVVDPVLCSTSGRALLDDAGVEAMMRLLLPRTTLLTPNIPEAGRLTGLGLATDDDFRAAASQLMARGCKAVLIKGGHADGADKTDHLYYMERGQLCHRAYRAAAVASRNTHGTGCTLSSAICAYLACGHSLPEAVARAKAYTTRAIRAAANAECGAGHGPLNHFFAPVAMIGIKN